MIEARVASHDARYELTTLAFAGGELVVPNVDALPGRTRARAHPRARRLARARAPRRDSSIQNVLAGDRARPSAASSARSST